METHISFFRVVQWVIVYIGETTEVSNFDTFICM